MEMKHISPEFLPDPLDICRHKWYNKYTDPISDQLVASPGSRGTITRKG
jgi:hypothetical protein